MKVKVQIKGDKELTKKIKRLDKKARGPVLETGVRAGAGIVQREASAGAPRGYTGKLARNIEVGPVEHTHSGAEVAISWTKEAFYGLYQEKGTSKQGAQPFLLPALESNKREIERAVGLALRVALRL